VDALTNRTSKALVTSLLPKQLPEASTTHTLPLQSNTQHVSYTSFRHDAASDAAGAASAHHSDAATLYGHEANGTHDETPAGMHRSLPQH
jgi:hypothetical protein